MKIINERNEKHLHSFIQRPCFTNQETKTTMSLIGAAQGRHSEAVLSQVYKFDNNFLDDEEGDQPNKKLITFSKHELFF